MAELKLLNELGVNETLLVLEPSRVCAARCVYCYVDLNRRSERAAKRRSVEDPGSFESTVERAFGPRHDPTDFAEWAVRNRLPIVYASGVEPWQDVAQARAILRVARGLGLPLFFQTKGLNWREVWDDVVPLAGNCGLYVSFPTPDDEVLARFEPGTPPASERRALVEAACDAGIPVMLAVAPFHPDWCADLPAHVASLLDLGVESVFLDTLHLSSAQAATLAGSPQRGASEAIAAAGTAWGDPYIEAAAAVRELCLVAGAGFEIGDAAAPRHGLDYVAPVDRARYARATPWPYVDQAYLTPATDQFGPDPGPPILIRWRDALAAMEATVDPRRYDQPFAWGPLRNQLRQVRKLPPAWEAALKPAAPFRDYLRALWNQPAGGPGWRHPFTRVAVRPDGTPWRDDAGDAVMLFDPDWPRSSQRRVVETLDGCRPLRTGGTP